MNNRGSIIGGMLAIAGLLFVLGMRVGIIDMPTLAQAVFGPEEQTTPELRPLPVVDGEFQVRYTIRRDRGWQQSRAGRVINQSGILRTVTEDVNSRIRLPRNIPLIVRACGEVNAYYDLDRMEIVLCDEYFYLLEHVFAPHLQGAEFEQAVLGATLFVVFHEIGHALVHQLDLSALGSEEDVADALATYLLVTNGASVAAYRGAESFFILQHLQPHHPLWAVHSLHGQRYYNITCLLAGADLQSYGWLIEGGHIPPQRAQWCPSEFENLTRRTERVLAPFQRG